MNIYLFAICTRLYLIWKTIVAWSLYIVGIFFFLFGFSFIVNNTSLENSLYWLDLIFCTITCEFSIVFFLSKLFEVVCIFILNSLRSQVWLSLVSFMKIDKWKKKGLKLSLFFRSSTKIGIFVWASNGNSTE